MNLARPCAAMLAAVLLDVGAPAFADDASPPSIVRTMAIDVAALPQAAMPAVLVVPDGDGDKVEISGSKVVGLVITPYDPVPQRKKGPTGRSLALRKGHGRMVNRKNGHAELVQIKLSAPEAGAFYRAESPESSSDALSTACGAGQGPTPMRWETLQTTGDGNAQLVVRDLWFDGKRCALFSEKTTSLPLKAVASEDGKPWLYAMRDAHAVTFVMPKSNDISVDAMVGTPTTIGGAITRVTLPLGRWGSFSIAASLPDLQYRPKSDESSSPIDITIELVQTMAEDFPTVLVRTTQPAPPERLADASSVVRTRFVTK